MSRMHEPTGDGGNKLDAKTLACLACTAILLTTLSSGISAGMGAAGAAILKNQHPDAYNVGTVAAAAAVGTAVIDFVMIFAILLFAYTTGNKLPSSENKSTLLGTAAGSAAATVLGALAGFGMLSAAGRAHGMELGPVAAAAAVGGVVVGGGLAVVGCCKGK